jgi:threonine synthase
MWKHHDVLPVRVGSKIVSLGEGATPLIKARSFPTSKVYFKNEAINPTGSHKDRAMSISITKAVEFGRHTVMLYSDGSTALASAAYAAQAGLRSLTVIPRGVPGYRLLPLAFYGSQVLEYQGDPAEALDWVRQACQSLGIFETSTYRRANPYAAEGPKTIGLEIFEGLERVPDWIIVPVGGGGTLAGIWRGFMELHNQGLSSKLPCMIGVLPEGYTLLEVAMTRGISNERELRSLACRNLPATIQAKIAMPLPPDGLEAIAAVRESSGRFTYACDREAVEAQKKLGSCEGIFAEPSAAAAMVGVEELLASGKFDPDEIAVAVITGSGFRETEAVADRVEVARVPIDPDSGTSALENVLRR